MKYSLRRFRFSRQISQSWTRLLICSTTCVGLKSSHCFSFWPEYFHAIVVLSLWKLFPLPHSSLQAQSTQNHTVESSSLAWFQYTQTCPLPIHKEEYLCHHEHWWLIIRWNLMFICGYSMLIIKLLSNFNFLGW